MRIFWRLRHSYLLDSLTFFHKILEFNSTWHPLQTMRVSEKNRMTPKVIKGWMIFSSLSCQEFKCIKRLRFWYQTLYTFEIGRCKILILFVVNGGGIGMGVEIWCWYLLKVESCVMLTIFCHLSSRIFHYESFSSTKTFVSSRFVAVFSRNSGT